MADLTTVRPLIVAALDEADTALGNETVTAQLAAKDAQIQQLTDDLAAANGKLGQIASQRALAKAADAQEDQAGDAIDQILAG